MKAHISWVIGGLIVAGAMLFGALQKQEGVVISAVLVALALGILFDWNRQVQKDREEQRQRALDEANERRKHAVG